MNIILVTTLVIAVIGICVGAGLVFTSKKFAVEVDEREVAVREKLPGNNCGACGFAGCDALHHCRCSGTQGGVCGLQRHLRRDKEPG